MQERSTRQVADAKQHRRGQVVIGLALSYPLLLLALSLLQVVSPQRSGGFALTQVFAPYLFLSLLALVPLCFLPGAVALRLALVVCCLVGTVRFAPRPLWASAQGRAAALPLTVMTWNVYAGNPQPDEVRRLLRTKPADIVALQEVNWRWIVGDAALDRVYPYRSPIAQSSRLATIVLSSYPIVAVSPRDVLRSGDDGAQALWVQLDLGRGRRLTVVSAHPSRPYLSVRHCARPLCFDPATRDTQIAQIRSLIAPFLERGDPLLLLGDFNVTEREPAYRELTAGLQDAHARVGAGPGHTWGPRTLHLLPGLELPLLRIDYLLSGPNVTPLGTTTDCSRRGSDHCILRGRYAVE